MAVSPASASVKSAASTLKTSSLKSTLKTTELAFVGFGSSRVIDTVGALVSIVYSSSVVGVVFTALLRASTISLAAAMSRPNVPSPAIVSTVTV